MREIEILSSISEEDFKNKIIEFTEKYGEPKHQTRLGIIFSSYTTGNKVDTRLKITNGKIHLVQKHGEGLKAFRSNIETELDLEKNSVDLLRFVRILQYMGTDIPKLIYELCARTKKGTS